MGRALCMVSSRLRFCGVSLSGRLWSVESACARRLCLCCAAFGEEIMYFSPFPSSCSMISPPRIVILKAKRDDSTAA